MKLSQYLTDRDLSQRAFARQIGVSFEAVCRWVNGHAAPQPRMVRRILTATAGAVRPEDFAAARPMPPVKTPRLMHYLVARALSMEEFAAELGVTTRTVSRYIHGERVPTRAVMARIVTATAGAVRPEDFYDQHIEEEAA